MGKGFGNQNQEQSEKAYKAYLDFLHKTLKIISKNQANQKVIHRFLETNQDKLDKNFSQFLRRWTTAQFLDNRSQQAYQTAIEILNFSILVATLFVSNRANNLEIAIAGYESILKVFTRSRCPQQWAIVQYSCGSVYLMRIQGDRAENIEKAIFHYIEALKENTFEKVPQQWAENIHCLGLAYRLRIKGKQNENLEKAIDCYQKALKVYSQELFPEKWADLQENLGNAYLLRKSGNSEDPELAIQCFLETLKVRTYQDLPDQWAMSQNNLGWAYRERIQGDKAENIEQAIVFFTEALQILTPLQHSEPWAQAQHNLGNAYLERIQGDLIENVEKAIECYQEALTIRTQESFPKQWVATQSDLSNAYLQRIRGERIHNIEQAIFFLKQVVKVCSKEYFPEQWAHAHILLGKAFLLRIRGDWVNNLEQAIEYYQKTLQIYTQETFPYLWAMTKQNLGKAYVEYLLQETIENNARVEHCDVYIKKAIECFQEALQVFTPKSFPEEWGTVKVDLGRIYHHPLREAKAEYIEQAIAYYQEALQVYTHEAFSYRWAEAQNNLGTAYINPILGDKVKNIEQGIDYLNRSLQERTRSKYPEDWAGTQYNLGVAYSKRILGEKTENIEQAISYFTAALEIYTPNTFPKNNIYAGKELGEIAFANQLWDKAIFGYGVAIEGIEIVRTWITSENRRQKALEENIDIYQNMVQACINTGQIDKAIEYVERSRSKRLVDLMAGNDLYGNGEIPQTVREFLQQYESLQQQIDNLRSQNDSGRDRGIINTNNRTRAALELDLATLSTLEAQKQKIWQQMRQLDPVLAGEIQVSAPNLTQMQQLIDKSTTAILSFFTTNTDTHVFVVRQNEITLHTCTGQGVDTLQAWLRQQWLEPYRDRAPDWIDSISLTLAELAKRLQMGELISQHLDGIEELIIIPHLLLHQIPFAAIPVESDRYLGDKFLLRYIPSCQVLEFCQQRQALETNLDYGIVEDAEENLACASFEGEQIASLYDIPRKQRLQGSQEATCQNYRQLIERVQVIHSCHHAQSRLDNPLESRLKLADGSITLGQLMTPGWRLPNLYEVFLSCCETGLGEPSLTDDIFTLATGFLCAGARSVISTLWSVNDLATALFSIFYYQQRKQGFNCPEALQKAQIQLRQLKQEDLTEIFKQTEIREKELIRERKKYLPGSADYSQWERQYKTTARITKILNKIRESSEKFPFSHPLYWAAFISQGLASSRIC
jgi:CHAT domain-containing protein/tetratricopeptide (TPR) repeat protein